MSKVVGTIEGKHRTVQLVRNKLGRICVKVAVSQADLPKKMRGKTRSPFQFHGCFLDASEAKARAEKLANSKK